MDFFMEKIVARRKKPGDYLIYAALVIAALIVLTASMLVSILRGIWPLIAVGAAYLAYHLMTSRNIEYEYIVTNGDLDIDMITAKRKRKRIFSANCKSFDLVAKYGSELCARETKNVENRLEMVSSMDSPNIYVIILNYSNKRTAVFFEPDKRMIDAFRKHIPRKIAD